MTSIRHSTLARFLALLVFTLVLLPACVSRKDQPWSLDALIRVEAGYYSPGTAPLVEFGVAPHGNAVGQSVHGTGVLSRWDHIHGDDSGCGIQRHGHREHGFQCAAGRVHDNYLGLDGDRHDRTRGASDHPRPSHRCVTNACGGAVL